MAEENLKFPLSFRDKSLRKGDFYEIDFYSSW